MLKFCDCTVVLLKPGEVRIVAVSLGLGWSRKNDWPPGPIRATDRLPMLPPAPLDLLERPTVT